MGLFLAEVTKRFEFEGLVLRMDYPLRVVAESRAVAYQVTLNVLSQTPDPQTNLTVKIGEVSEVKWRRLGCTTFHSLPIPCYGTSDAAGKVPLDEGLM